MSPLAPPSHHRPWGSISGTLSKPGVLINCKCSWKFCPLKTRYFCRNPSSGCLGFFKAQIGPFPIWKEANSKHLTPETPPWDVIWMQVP